MWNQIATIIWEDGSTLDLFIKGQTIVFAMFSIDTTETIQPDQWESVKKALEEDPNIKKVLFYNMHLIPEKILTILTDVQ